MGEDIMFTRKSSPGISLVFILIKKLNILLYCFPGWDTSHTVKQDDSETVRIRFLPEKIMHKLYLYPTLNLNLFQGLMYAPSCLSFCFIFAEQRKQSSVSILPRESSAGICRKYLEILYKLSVRTL